MAFASAPAIVADGRTLAKFSIEQSVTAKLVLRGGTANLINLVCDQRTDIHGILNTPMRRFVDRKIRLVS